MSVARNGLKRSLAPGVLAFLVVVVAVAVLAIAALHRTTTEGADPADAFTDVPEGATALEGIVRWLPDAELQERVMEPPTRLRLEAAWTRAWEALQRAARGDGSLLEAWFAGPALAQVSEGLASTEGALDLLVGPARLQVRFYSDDGSVVGLFADPVRTSRIVEVDGRRRELVTDEAIDVVMVLEDGNWRVRQWRRVGVEVVLVES